MIEANYKISIVTVCYNSAATIKDTLVSVLQQGRDDVQHVIVDGASTDATLSIIETYREQYQGRLLLLSEPDKGIYDAMNKGVQLAQGTFIGILNSDDYFASNQVLNQIVAVLDETTQFVYGNLKIIDNVKGQVIRQWNAGYGNYLKGWIPPHPTMYIRKSLYQEVGDYDLNYKISADYDMMLRCLAKVDPTEIRYVDKDFVYMRIGGVSNKGLHSITEGIKQIHSILKKNSIPHPMWVNGIRLIKKLSQY